MSNNKYNKVDCQIMLVNISGGFIWIHTTMNPDDNDGINNGYVDMAQMLKHLPEPIVQCWIKLNKSKSCSKVF